MIKKLTLAVLMALTLSACGFETVDTGNAGIKKTLGKVQEEVLDPGFYTYNPFISSVYEISIQTQKYEFATQVYTKDVQQAKIAVALNFNLDKSKAVKMYSDIGTRYQDNLIPQVVSGSLKNVIGKWNAIDLIANREKATSEINAMVSMELAKTGINVTQLQIIDINFAAEFERAVEAKVVAVQRAEEAKNKTVEVQEAANQRIISAKADAEAMRIKTQALSQNKSLVLYEAVQKWNGQLPRIVTQGQGMMLNIPDDKE